eukprot:SAG31_NODE_1814_length_7210_cov_12.878920_3_plen_1696_part_00
MCSCADSRTATASGSTSLSEGNDGGRDRSVSERMVYHGDRWRMWVLEHRWSMVATFPEQQSGGNSNADSQSTGMPKLTSVAHNAIGKCRTKLCISASFFLRSLPLIVCMSTSVFVCSCAAVQASEVVGEAPSLPGSTSESKNVSSVVFDDSDHCIFYGGTCLVNIGFRIKPEISVNYSVFADSDTSENNVPGLVFLYSISFIIVLVFINAERTLGVHPGFDTVLRKCHKPWSLRYKRSKQLGIVCLFLLVFQPAAAAVEMMTDASQRNEIVSTSAVQNVDLSQLTLIDFSDPQQLKKLFGSFQKQLHQLAKDKETLENKTQLIETMLMKENPDQMVLQEENTALKKRVASLERIVVQLSNKTTTESQLLKAKLENISVRLDQCEHDSFEQIMDRRRNQEQSSVCGLDAVQSMLAVCCSSGPVGNGHRRVQADGCDSLPPVCSLECSSQFISIFENCQGQPVLEQLPPGQLAQWRGFLGQCQEVQQAAAQLSVADAQPAMIFHCLVLDDAAQSQADMFGQVISPVLPVGPLQPIVTPPSPTPVSDGGVAQVQEFRRVCTRANLTVCAPPCNQASDGFLLSILIGGRGTMMTCNQEEGVFSWQGQSALGSCITRRAQTWLENIITHAAGTFALELALSVAVLTAADLVAGQSAMLHGAVGGSPPVWTYSGEGSAFIVGAGAELEISAVTVAATSGLAFRIADSSTIMVTSLQLQKGDGSADVMSCAALATGVGQAGLTCADTGFGSVNVAGPLFISTSGTGFGMGATKYMGDDRGVFEEAVSTREPGLYTCQISHDQVVTLTLPVESAMHVSIVGDDSMPQWSFTGEGLAFTVAVHAYLNLAYVTVPGGQISLMRGGEVSLDHVQMQRTQLHVAGSLAASNSQLTDVQFETEAAAVMTMDAVTLTGTGEETRTLPIGCSMTISGGEIRNVELQVTSDGELIVTDTAIHVEGMAVAVATRGSFTISTSQLIHDEITDPFPCNGANMACTGPHTGSVIVAGPASINTAAPLVCADDRTGSCLSGYVEMSNCLADIARGMESCFVYLQRDTRPLGMITVTAEQQFEIHGQQIEPKLQLQTDWTIRPSAIVVLADLLLFGGDGASGSELIVATGGQLTMQSVQSQNVNVSFSGTVSIIDCEFVVGQLWGSSLFELSISGGTVTQTTMILVSGRATFGESCVFSDSHVDIAGSGGTLSATECQFQSDGTLTPLTIGSGGSATLVGTDFQSTAGDITTVTVAVGGSFTVSSSQLIHGEVTDPFPCNGANMACTGPHAGSAMVAGPASINTVAPLVCADESAGSCLSGYIDMPSCLADIARGLSSCFVYLQQDTGELGTILVDAGEHFEIHGDHGEPKLRILADFGVGGALILVDLQIVDGSGDGSQISVEAGGGLTFDRVEMEGGSLTLAGAVSVMGSSLVEVTVTASSGSELTFSGGNVARSTVTVTSGRMTVDTGCALTDSPVAVGGAGSAVTISSAELQSDGLSVPLTIRSGGAATVTQTEFRGTAGDITAVSVAEGGIMTVGESQLVGADRSTDSFPCDGTLPDCVGEHAGSVVVEGPSVINMMAPLVCDVGTGVCLSDMCFVVDCGAHADCVSPHGTCDCRNGYSGGRCDIRGECCSRFGCDGMQSAGGKLGTASDRAGNAECSGDSDYGVCADRLGQMTRSPGYCGFCVAFLGARGWTQDRCDAEYPGWDDECDRAC